MMISNTIYIHPNDETTEFLSVIHSKIPREAVITENDSNAFIKHTIMQADKVVMLGHGTDCGLFGKKDKYGNYDRTIINSSHVEFLRDKECIGIWCNANMFAEKYDLKGLFSGMIISEIDEAVTFGIETTPDELYIENKNFANRLNYCLTKYELKDIPYIMKELDETKSQLTLFNYNNLYYYE